MKRTYDWKIYKVAGTDWEYWYDRQFRVWVACRRDSEGNQINGAIDHGTKAGIIKNIQMEIGR